MRTGPGTGYSVITVVPVGTNVFIVEDNGQGWSYVDYNGTQGWVSSSYLGGYAPAAAPAVSDYGDYTVTTDVNLRAGPGTGYDVYIVVPGGSTVGVDSTANGWAHAYYANYEGYISTGYIAGLSGSTGGSSYSGSTGKNGTTWYGGNNYANVYDYKYYLAHNQDLISVLGTDPNTIIAHFVNSGMNEGRQAISSFNVYTYRSQHPDLAAEFGDNLRFYYLYACGIPFTY